MLRALRRRCAGPTLRILVIGVEGAEPTPSVHPSGEPEEPTGVQFPGLQHTVGEAALGLRHGGRGDGLGPACGRGSGEEVVRGEGRPVRDARGRLRLVPWRPRRKESTVPPVPQADREIRGSGSMR